ncbi:MAG: hypothetical protein ABR985_19220 [Methanotrichaceae archaeon]
MNKKYVSLSLLLVITLIAVLPMAAMSMDMNMPMDMPMNMPMSKPTSTPHNTPGFITAAMSESLNKSKAMEKKTEPVSTGMQTTQSGNNRAPAADNGVTENVSASTVPNGNTSETAKAASEIAKMKGIWSLTEIKQKQIMVALQQDGEDLFGQAKDEPEGGVARNAVVIGSVSGDNVALVITALEGKEQVSAWLNGTYADDTLNGKFFEVSNGKISNRGDFTATLVNPEISEYTPATVTEPVSSDPKNQGTTQTLVTSTPTKQTTVVAGNQASTTLQPVAVGGRKKPVDVHQYADKTAPAI